MVDKQFLDEIVVDVLVEGPIHKTMLFFCRTERWPTKLVWLVAVGGAVLVGAVWAWLGRAWLVGSSVALMHIVWLGWDAAILQSLPRQRISFGPWKAQLLVLLVPRLIVALGLALANLWLAAWWLLLLALLAQIVITAAYAWGLLVEIHRLRLTHLTVTTDRLTAASPPIRLLHLTDLHVERLTHREAEVLRIAKEAQPDLIVITGDYVNLSYNQDPQTHAQVRQLLSQLAAPYGVYATLGSPPVDLRPEIVRLFRDLPLKLLRHDCEVVQLGPGRELIVLGMDCTHHLATDRQRLAWLMEGVPQQAPRLFLYHSPELMPEAVQHSIDLYLCGHTHGGQVRLPFIGPLLTSSRLGRRYVMGPYREGRTHLYVSRGIGLEGLSAPRVRFMAPPEMTLVTLRGTKEAEELVRQG